MKRFLLPAACLLVALAGANALAQSAPILIRFSHVVGADTPKGRAAELFRMRAEELTKGRVKVEVHHNASLFQDGNEVAALQAGQVEMLAPSLSKFGPIGVREFEIFDTPYLFADRRMLQKVLAGPVGRTQSWLRLFGQYFLTDKWTPAGRLIHGAADGSFIPARGERPGG